MESNQFRLLELLGAASEDSDGSTGAAAMRGEYHDCSPFVARAVKHCCDGLEDKNDVPLVSEKLRTYVGSLALVIISRQLALAKDFAGREWEKFLESLKKTASVLLPLIRTDDETTFLKYWLNYFHCQVFLDKELPERDTCVTTRLFFTWIARFVARRIAKRDVSFIYSLSKGSKLAWPQLSEAKKEKALRKHLKNLSSCFHGRSFAEDLESNILSASNEIFEQVGTNPVKMCPSASACLQASRRGGGALNMMSGPGTLEQNPDLAPLGRLRGMNELISRYQQQALETATRNFTKELIGGYVQLFPLSPDLRPLGLPVRNLSTGQNRERDPMDLEIVAVPEPGKFRIISKGNGNLYTALQPIQGEMLNAWKRTSWSSMFRDDLTERVAEIDAACQEDFWMSVDYESATDLLHRRATLLALQGCWRSPSFELAEYSFSMGHGIYKFADETLYVRLAEGQPMGHPLSFPLLCTINLAVYFTSVDRWLASRLNQLRNNWLDQYGEVPSPLSASDQTEVDDLKRRAKIMRENVLVNGDDMLFKCPADFKPIFYQTAAEVGFKISLGKNYFSPDCCMMNSQVFKRTSGRMRRVGYLNQRLTSGINVKKGGGTSAAIPTQLGKDVGKMVALAPWTKSVVPMCFSRFSADYHGYRPNWYLPVHLGGYGVPIELAPPGLRITREQRTMAACFVNDPKLALYAVKRAAGNESIRLSDHVVGRTKWVVGDWVPTIGEALGEEWLLEQCLLNQLNAKPSEDSEVRTLRPKRSYRLKPMTVEGLAKYWSARPVVESSVPVQPAKKLLRAPNFMELMEAEGREIDLPFDGLCAWGVSKRLQPDARGTRKDRIYQARERQRKQAIRDVVKFFSENTMGGRVATEYQRWKFADFSGEF